MKSGTADLISTLYHLNLTKMDYSDLMKKESLQADDGSHPACRLSFYYCLFFETVNDSV